MQPRENSTARQRRHVPTSTPLFYSWTLQRLCNILPWKKLEVCLITQKLLVKAVLTLWAPYVRGGISEYAFSSFCYFFHFSISQHYYYFFKVLFLPITLQSLKINLHFLLPTIGTFSLPHPISSTTTIIILLPLIIICPRNLTTLILMALQSNKRRVTNIMAHRQIISKLSYKPDQKKIIYFHKFAFSRLNPGRPIHSYIIGSCSYIVT